jgi:hypothetical protein
MLRSLRAAGRLLRGSLGVAARSTKCVPRPYPVLFPVASGQQQPQLTHVHANVMLRCDLSNDLLGLHALPDTGPHPEQDIITDASVDCVRWIVGERGALVCVPIVECSRIDDLRSPIRGFAHDGPESAGLSLLHWQTFAGLVEFCAESAPPQRLQKRGPSCSERRLGSRRFLLFIVVLSSRDREPGR